MSLDEVLVSEGATLRETLEQITKSGKQLAVIVDADRHLLGIVTDGDLRKAILRGITLDARIDEAMNRSPVIVGSGTSATAALTLMRSRSIRQLPVVDDTRHVVDVLFFDDLREPGPLPNAVVIMAGGTGSRLRPLTETTPKPLLKVGGKPLLEIMVERLRGAGFRRIFMTLHYKSHLIADYFGDGSRLGVRIRPHYEDTPRGTAGALRDLLQAFEGHPFLLVNGDILTKCDFRSMLAFHEEHRAEMTVGTVPHTVEVPYGILDVDGVHLSGVNEKPRLDFVINAGMYIVSPHAVSLTIPSVGIVDVPDVISKLVKLNQRVVAFPIREYWLDVGRHGDFEKANRDVAEGLLE